MKLTLLLLLGSMQVASTEASNLELGTISGRVVSGAGEPVHHASVLLVQTGLSVECDHEGAFVFTNVEPGLYDLFAAAANFTSQVKLIEVPAGGSVTIDLFLQLSPVRESVTVTARGRHETTFEAVQSVTTLDSFDIAERSATSVGEVLEGEPGVSKRSFGPGSSRPVVRGFDGDRVLILDDGMPIGSLGSQSGDHGEPIDSASLERLEVVKGPSTLLYGSNAIGGVVNAISRHHELHKHPHEGFRGQLSASFGTNNGLAGSSASAEYGLRNWMVWGGGGSHRTSDYATPQGTVDNSRTRISDGTFGVGWFNDKSYFSGSYSLRDGRYGIPFATEFHEHEGIEEEEEEEEEEEVEAVSVGWRYHNLRFNLGLTDLSSFIENVRLGVNYTDWSHQELEALASGEEEVGTDFSNQQLSLRADFDHRRSGPWSGTFGIWLASRDYNVVGEEALSPPVDQNSFAVFALEEFAWDRFKLQVGGRVEHVEYQPLGVGMTEHGQEALPDRRFTGFSAGAGARLRLWENGALVGHFTSSHRAPALEELYNFGPHVGNLAFEVGNPSLDGERSNGLDISLRHSGERLAAEFNFFYYKLDDFIFGAPTGEIEDGLFVYRYEQADSRFVGTEINFDLALMPDLWLNLGMDYVDAQLTDTGIPIPRIPPLRGRVGVDFRIRGLSLRPEVVMASNQSDVFITETRTPGYAVVNLKAAYTLPRQHFVHHFGFEVFNVGDTLYRNHVSIIKDLAPEIGRGVRFSYSMKFF